MYVFIHQSEPAEVVRLPEAINLSVFGRANLATDVYSNDKGEMVSILPPEANGDGIVWGSRLMAGYKKAQEALREGKIGAIAQSPINGRWVKIPSEYWIAQRSYVEILSLDDKHELHGAPIVVDRKVLAAWSSILRECARDTKPMRRERAYSRQQRTAFEFFEVAQGLDVTQQRLHERYLRWHADQKRRGEPLGLSAFKKWYVLHRDKSV